MTPVSPTETLGVVDDRLDALGAQFPELDLPKLVEDYNRDGYFIVRQFFSPEEVEEIRAIYEKIHQDGFEGQKESEGTPEGKSPRMFHAHRWHPRVRHYMLHPKLRAVLEACMGGEPVATQTMYFYKPPGGRGQSMHQDNFFLMVQPGTCMGQWTAIDATDQANGCVMVVPKSHKLDVICHDAPSELNVSDSSRRVPVPKGLERPVPAIMQPGDTLFFHGNGIHGSGPNRTKDRFRRAFVSHYARGDLSRISRFYLPLVRMDGTDYTVEPSTGGGPCGPDWEGAGHY